MEAGLGGDDGILELEEVDGVEVVYETTESGRVARFQVGRKVISTVCPGMILFIKGSCSKRER